MKEAISNLIEKLASKELTFGCRVSIYSGEPKLEAVLCKHNQNDWVNIASKRKSFKILGHPILIGNVMQKIFDKEDGLKYIKSYRPTNYFRDGADNCPLIDLWAACGFTKSLQSIVDEAEWEGEQQPNGQPKHVVGSRIVLVPKQPHIRELFQFLLQLGL